MSMTLILWKAPVVDDPDDAEELLKPYYESADDSAFEPSDALAKVSDELLRRFPESDDGPWSDSPALTDRLLVLDIRWSADNKVLDAIADLAREHGLVLYDPQGPDITLPTDVIDNMPVPQLTWTDYAKFLPFGFISAFVFWIGWKIDVPVIEWILMIAGGFFFTVVLFLYGIFIFGPKEEST